MLSLGMYIQWEKRSGKQIRCRDVGWCGRKKRGREGGKERLKVEKEEGEKGFCEPEREEFQPGDRIGEEC